MQSRTLVRRYPLRDGTLVTFDNEAAYEALLTALTQLLDEERDAIAGPSLVIDVGPRALGTDQILDLEALIRRSLGPRVLQIVSGEAADILREDSTTGVVGEGTEAEADAAAAAAAPAGHQAAGAPVPAGTPAGLASPAVLLRRTIRSGQRVTYDGSIVILGDVNPGGEVIATGDIIVLGTLRGLAHAGARSRDRGRIVALRLEPTQLRIGDCIGRAPDQPPRSELCPEVAYVAEDGIVVEPLLGRADRLARLAGL